jgi:hypothetical protein
VRLKQIIETEGHRDMTNTYPTKRTNLLAGVYKTDAGWKHSEDAHHVWEDKTAAITDYQFCTAWKRADA